jgi:hypothetical protein
VTPSNFFISVQHLFGVMLPGIIWITSSAILMSNQDPLPMLHVASVPEIALLLIAAYVMGYVMRGWAFSLGCRASDLFHYFAKRVAKIPEVRRYLRRRSKTQQYGLSFRYIQNAELIQGARVAASQMGLPLPRDDRRVPGRCKHFILGRDALWPAPGFVDTRLN